MVTQVVRGFGPLSLAAWILAGAMLTFSFGMAGEPATQYRLGPNDQLRIEVFGEQDLSGEAKIDGQGNVQLPLVGALVASGKTIAEFQQVVTERLASGYVRNPRVTIRVVKHRNFFVSGEVKNPGSYSYEEGLTVGKVLTLGGGLTERADRHDFIIKRQMSGQEETVPAQPDSPVHPDDIVVVAEGRKFFVSGEVKTPGRYLYEKGMTIHKALSVAGGRTDKGEKGPVKVTRVTNGVAETVTVTGETGVQPDDILVVEQEHHKVYVSGEVKTPGGYPYQEGLTVHRAVAMAGGLTEKAERGMLQVLRRVEGREDTMPVQLDSVIQADDIIVVSEGRKFFVSGEVKTPGRYLYEKGMTIHKALSVAGGRTDKGEKGPIKVTRVTNGVAETVTVTGEAGVQPDDILVVEQEHHKVYVSGEVKTPGGYPYQEGLTVHRAVAMAGGLTEKAERGTLQVLRRVEGREDTVPVHLDSVILPDDIVVVAEGQKFFVSGEVKTPGRYLYEKGLTIEKAVGLAGGRNEKAEKHNVKVTRIKEGVARSIDADTDIAVEPNDVIVVPELKKVYVDGEVKRAGDYPFQRDLTVHKAITMAGGVTDKASLSSAKILRKVNGREETIPATLDGPLQPEDIIVVPRSFF